MKVQIKWPVGICQALVFGRGVSLCILCLKVDQSNLSTLWAMERVLLQPDIAFRQYFTHFGLREFFVGSLPCPLHLISRKQAGICSIFPWQHQLHICDEATVAADITFFTLLLCSKQIGGVIGRHWIWKLNLVKTSGITQMQAFKINPNKCFC